MPTFRRRIAAGVAARSQVVRWLPPWAVLVFPGLAMAQPGAEGQAARFPELDGGAVACTDVCAEEGRCDWDPRREACVATDQADCRRSDGCRRDGACYLHREDGECDDEVDRLSHPLWAVGLLHMGLGSLGAWLAFYPAYCGFMSENGEDCSSEHAAAKAMWGMSATSFIGGLGMLVAGLVPVTRVEVSAGPTGAALRLRF